MRDTNALDLVSVPDSRAESGRPDDTQVAQHFSAAAIGTTTTAAETENGQFPKSSGSLDEF